MEKSIQGIMGTTLENLKRMIDVNTVVGTPVMMGDGTTIIPVSKVSLGFLSGGGDFAPGCTGKNDRRGEPAPQLPELPFAGGAGAGVSVAPIAFLVAGNGKVQLLPVCCTSPYDRLIDMIPGLVSDVKDVIGCQCKQDEKQDSEDAWRSLEELPED